MMVQKDMRLPAALVLLLLNFIDVFMTLTVLKHGAHEVNPIAAWLIKHHVIWAFKLGIPAVIIVLLFFSEYQPVTERLLYLAVIVYSFVVLWNVITLVIAKAHL